MNKMNRIVLKNGLTLLSERIDYVQSVSMGIWVKVGSRDESSELAGISHFLEHMNFKGTEKRNAKELAEVLECRGGSLNAYTTKEYTYFYAQAVKEDMDLAMDVLSDIFLHSAFRSEDIEKEKKVVLEEINLYEDSPEDQIVDMLNELCWPNHALGRPILGYSESVTAFERDTLLRFRAENYTPRRTVLAVVGAFDEDELIRAAEKYFGDFAAPENPLTRTKPLYHTNRLAKEKDIAQEHICIGFPAYSLLDEKRYAQYLLNEYLGGCASSVLFQKIREEMALSYSVYSFLTEYEDTGMLMICAGTSPGLGQQVEELCMEEVIKIRENGIPGDALQKMKNQINGLLRISSDSMSTCLNRLGRNELLFGRQISVAETVKEINAVDDAKIKQAAQDIFDAETVSFCTLGAKND